jgi:hypothetical protein
MTKTFLEAVAIGQISTAEALELFDQLDPVTVEFMLGAWRGSSFPTGHPLDGMLETYHWHGKRFDSAEQVHPLVFRTATGGTASLHPLWALPLVGWLDRLPIPKTPMAGDLFQAGLGLLATQQSTARLRLSAYRGQTSATMIYDHLPINDVFRQVDDNTVLGLMDLKGSPQPFFFVLRRE